MAERSEEFELKFTGSPTEIAALPQSLILTALDSDAGEWERLDTTYYDTTSGDLARIGLSLRLREEGGALIQAIKQSRAGGASILRDEVETPVAKRSSFPAVSGDAEFDEIIQGLKSQLVPIGRTVSDRWTTLAAFRRSKIELSIDLGRVESWSSGGGHFQAPLAELELELKEGRPEDVFDLGRLLASNAALRLSPHSKLQSALILQEGGPYRIAPPVKITAAVDESAGDILQRALGAIASRMAALQPALLDARRVEGVHQMRIALRRLRATERIFRPYLAGRGLRNLAEMARTFARRLGEARDWDVFLEETLPSALASGYAPERPERLKRICDAKRAEGWAGAVAVIGDPAFTIFLIDLMEAAVVAPWRDRARDRLSAPARDFAPRALDRALKKTSKKAKSINLDHVVELHQLRIALKKLRYPVQMFRSLYPKTQRKEYMAALSALQENFGAVNDAVVAQGLANEAAIGNGDDAMRVAGFVCGYKAAEADAAAKRIREVWPDFMQLQPFWRD